MANWCRCWPIFIFLHISDMNVQTQYLDQFILIILVKVNATFATHNCDVIEIEI